MSLQSPLLPAQARTSGRHRRTPVPLAAEPEAARLARENEKLRQQIAILLLDVGTASGTAAPSADVTPESLPATSDAELDGQFDPTLYGMSADYDDQGNFVFPTGFDPETGKWLAGSEVERNQRERQYAAAHRRFSAHRRLFATSGHDLTVTAEELDSGGVIEIWPPGHDSVIIRLPAGTADGQVLRVPDYGLPLPDGQEVGTLLVTVAAGAPAPASAATTDPLASATAHT
jgi:hypothetical protein